MLPATRHDEEIARALVEHEVGHHARVGAAQDRRDRILRLRPRRASRREVALVRSVARVARVAVHEALQRFVGRDRVGRRRGAGLRRIGGLHACRSTPRAAASAPAPRKCRRETSSHRVQGRRIVRTSPWTPSSERSKGESNFRALRDRALGVELERHVGAADQLMPDARRVQAPAPARAAAPGRRRSRSCRPRARCGAPSTVMCSPASSIRTYSTPASIATPRRLSSARRIQPVVFARPAPTFDSLRCRSHTLRRRAMLVRGASVRRATRSRRRCPTLRGTPRSRDRRASPSLDVPVGRVLRGQEFRDVEADAAGADDRHRAARRACVLRRCRRSSRPSDGRCPGSAARAARCRSRRSRRRIPRGPPRPRAVPSASSTPSLREPRAEVAQRLGELLLARDAPREVELAADLGRRVEQRHEVPALGRRGGRGEAGRTRADDGDRLLLPERRRDEHRLVARVRIDEARRDVAREDLVEAGLVAADAGVDLVGAVLRPPCSRSRRRRGTAAPSTPCRRRRARAPPPPVAGSLMRLVVMSGIFTAPFSRRVTHANAARGTIVAMVGMRASCQPMPVLMMRGARRLDGLRERDHLVPRAAALDEVEHRQAVDDDEVARRRPRACGARSRPGSGCGSRSCRPTRRRGSWSAAR